MTLTWHIAQVSQAGRRAAVALREHGFNVFCPMEVVRKGGGVIERPLFPGYLFIGAAPWNDVSILQETDGRHRIDGLTRIMETGLSKERLAALVYDMALRQCAGEFDQSGAHRYLPPKPLIGPLNKSIGHGLSALEQLLREDDNGRLELLLSGAITPDEHVESVGEPVKVAA